MLRQRITEELKVAMKAKEPVRLATLRLMNAAIKDRDIAARREDRCDGVSDDEVMQILSKMAKQREESSITYEQAGRLDLAEKELLELEIVRSFLPKQMSEDEIKAAVDTVVKDLSAAGLKDMGRCMGQLKERHAGAMDSAAQAP